MSQEKETVQKGVHPAPHPVHQAPQGPEVVITMSSPPSHPPTLPTVPTSSKVSSSKDLTAEELAYVAKHSAKIANGMLATPFGALPLKKTHTAPLVAEHDSTLPPPTRPPSATTEHAGTVPPTHPPTSSQPLTEVTEHVRPSSAAPHTRPPSAQSLGSNVSATSTWFAAEHAPPTQPPLSLHHQGMTPGIKHAPSRPPSSLHH